MTNKKLLLLWVFVLLGFVAVAHADVPVLTPLCTYVDCLNNFTVKTGYSFKFAQEGTGGFTDLEQNWYISPAPGFNFLKNESSTPNFDGNIVFKFGKLLNDKVPAIHDLVASNPIAQGLMKYATFGESGAWDSSRGPITKIANWYDMTWIGATVQF